MDERSWFCSDTTYVTPTSTLLSSALPFRLPVWIPLAQSEPRPGAELKAGDSVFSVTLQYLPPPPPRPGIPFPAKE